MTNKVGIIFEVSHLPTWKCKAHRTSHSGRSAQRCFPETEDEFGEEVGLLNPFHQKIPMYLSYMRIIIYCPFTNAVKVMKDSEGILNPSKSIACSIDLSRFPEWSVVQNSQKFLLDFSSDEKLENDEYCLRCGTTMSSANLGMKILE